MTPNSPVCTQTENTSLLPRAIKSWIWLLTLVIAESVAFGEDGHAADSFEGVNESNPNRFARARKPRTEEAEVQTDDVHVGDLVETETNVKRVNCVYCVCVCVCVCVGVWVCVYARARS